MIYIIGVHHDIQYRFWRPAEEYVTFENHLAEEISKRSVTLIAEEFSPESLRPYRDRVTETVCQNAARNFNIEHRFCDPTSEERNRLGIPNQAELKERLGLDKFPTDAEWKLVDEEARKYWMVREMFWLEKIRDAKERPTLFICGNGHVERFRRRLETEGIRCEVISVGWGQDAESPE